MTRPVTSAPEEFGSDSGVVVGAKDCAGNGVVETTGADDTKVVGMGVVVVMGSICRKQNVNTFKLIRCRPSHTASGRHLTVVPRSTTDNLSPMVSGTSPTT